MMRLNITLENVDYHIPFRNGDTIREILHSADISLRSDCGGFGTCGLCLVGINEGNVPDFTNNELQYLSKDQLVKGSRLACQVQPHADIQ
ncbi:MAG: 2Fe-2S iron-sulfur cluster binding domain-containing protein, partial [Candidatus Marinimicrobia bacterium]|nr:2Fe-2S iron-sulfur cluster binding domain-containing protein [Candidatus Neomarinimicrobiota bacterium]